MTFHETSRNPRSNWVDSFEYSERETAPHYHSNIREGKANKQVVNREEKGICIRLDTQTTMEQRSEKSTQKQTREVQYSTVQDNTIQDRQLIQPDHHHDHQEGENMPLMIRGMV